MQFFGNSTRNETVFHAALLLDPVRRYTIGEAGKLRRIDYIVLVAKCSESIDEEVPSVSLALLILPTSPQ